MAENIKETKEYILERDCELRFEVEKFVTENNEKKEKTQVFVAEVCLHFSFMNFILICITL